MEAFEKSAWNFNVTNNVWLLIFSFKKELDDLKKHINLNFKHPHPSLHYVLNPDSITLFGYTATVKSFTDSIHSKFNNLENNIKDRCKRKLDVRFSVAKIPNITMLTYSGGFYLKEFASSLARLDAHVELLNAEATSFKINCQMNPTKQQRESAVVEWRNRIDTFVTHYFGKFRTVKIQLAGCSSLDEAMVMLSAAGLTDKTKLTWAQGNYYEISGLLSEVDKIVSNYESIKKVN